MREKIFKFDVIAPFLTELYCQISIVGYRPILTEKLLNTYSFSKNMKFYVALYILSVFLGSLGNLCSPAQNNEEEEEKDKNKKENEKEKKRK